MFGTSVQFLGYSFVGAIGTVVHYVVLFACADGPGLDPVLATSLGAVFGAITNYLLNYRFTFRSRRPHRDASPKFFWVATVGIVVNGLVVDACLRFGAMHYVPAQLLATTVVLAMGYIANRHWTFKDIDMRQHELAPPTQRAIAAIVPPRSYRLSVVVPAYNEQEVLPEFHRRLGAVLDSLGAPAEIVYVNDGSRDQTIGVIHALRAADPRVSIIDLSRNFGKEAALTAGLDHAAGDVVVVIDADLQDPPELIPELVTQWQAGFDVVYAQRTARDGETLFKKATASLFYRLIHHVSLVEIPGDTGDFRLLSRRAVSALKQLREQHRFMKGLFAWIGYPQKAVPYRRDPRFAGQTKWNYWKLWNFALEGITSFTIAPLKIATYVGVCVALLAFLFAAWIIYKTIVFGDPVRGYPSLMVVVLFLGGVQLLFIGVMGEYLGRLFNETKRRPLYLVNAYEPAASVAEVASQPPQSESSRWPPT